MVRIELLGGFRVVVDGEEISAGRWPGRRAEELVQLLALVGGRRLLLRDQVIDALWPHLDVQAGGANLRKAAHHVRQALDNQDAVALHGGQVALLPDRPVECDAEAFEAAAEAALAGTDPDACAAAAALYTGTLLPDLPYEEWTQEPRARLRSRCAELLRRTEDWERLVGVDATDEAAYRELMRSALENGSRPAAIRWYGRLKDVLRRELRIAPDARTQALYDECVAGLEPADPGFVGRQLELARATALLRSARAGSSAVLAVRGPGGVGKTAFCRELGGSAEDDGWHVLSTTATQSAAPYAPLVAVVQELEANLPDAFDAVRERGRQVLTEMAGGGSAGALPPTRHQVIGALRRVMLAAGAGGPVLLVVDDAHLADEATLDAIEHLGAAGPAPLVAMLSYRPESVPAALSRGLGRLGRAGAVVDIDLQPLSVEEGTLLVQAASPIPRSAGVVERIIDLAGGNPFLTLELARSAVAGVPGIVQTARDGITARFVDLDEAVVARLRQIALAGDDLDPASIVAVLGCEEADAFALLDTALREGVLVVSGGTYRFRHDLVRQALIEQLTPHERLAGHRSAAHALADVGASPALVARHWLEADRPDEAAGWLLTAATQASALGAYADALAQLGPLLAHEPEHPGALRMRAEALDALGDPAAPAAYAEAARVIGGREAQDLMAMRALATIKLGDGPGALAILEHVDAVSPDGRLAQALAFSGAAALGFADPAEGTARAAEARRLALRTGDRAYAAVASWAHAAAAHARGELHDTLRTDLNETRALPKLAVSVFDGQLCMTQRLLYGARPYAEVIAFADALGAEADRLGAARGKAFAVTIRGEARLLAGDLEEAERDLQAGIDLHRDIGAATGESFALQRRAEARLYRGDHEGATALLDEALGVASESDVGFHLLDRIYGTRVTAAGHDPASCRAALEEAEAAVRGPIETCPGCRITLAIPAAIAAAQAGDEERMAAWEPVAEYLTSVVMRLPAWDAALEEVRGHYALARGDEAGARKRFLRAAAGFAAAEHPLDQARCSARAAA